MKKAILIMVFGAVAMMLLAAVGITSINMEDDGGAVCRVVINLSEKAKYSISQSSGTLSISFHDFDVSTKARIYAANSDLITAIEQNDEVLKLSIAKPFRYETMFFDYPQRLVVDVFISSPNKAQRLVIAAFYSEMGKYNSADRAYSALQRDYPQDDQILYQWALLLKRRHSSRVMDVVAMIPENSQYYERGQKLLAKLTGDNEPLMALPEEPKTPAEEVESVPEEVTAQDGSHVSITEQVEEAEKPASIQPKPVVKTAKSPYLIHILLLIGLLMLLAVVLYFLFTGKKQPKIDLLADELPDHKEDEASNKILRRMVTKLLDDGWTNKEIAREMKLSVGEVERLIHFRYVDSSDDETN